jgi:flagellar biosynthesis/type III secretory pathway protein FliH
MRRFRREDSVQKMAEAGAYSERHGAGFLRAILDRFRGGAAVPAAVSDDLAVELAPLFLALDAVETETARIRTAAQRRAAAISDEAKAEIEQILSDAKQEAQSERAKAIEAGRRAAVAEASAIEACARQEAEQVKRIGRARIAPLVADVLRCIEAAPR